ncbi:MAG: hypothetical protein K2K70_06435 [Lachnospiraceae bacterium]|nr:hypothetical protein [Lachnospiraceae bacterium]
MKLNEIAKRSLGILLVFSMVLGGLYINGTSVKAEETLKANKEVKGTILEGQSITYNFTMPKKGYFSFRLSSSLDFLRVTMKVNYKTWENDEIVNCNNLYTSSYYSFKPGTKVQITLASTYYDKKDYTLCVDVKNVTNFESESNDKRSQANTIKLKKTYTGLIMSEDADWYVFKAPKKGKYKIVGVNTTRDYVNYATYRGYKAISHDELGEGNGYKTLFSGKLKKGQKIYLKISYDSLSAAKGVFYKIKVKKK